MNKRMVEFIRAIRAAGVRVSLAESLDAMHGVEAIGITDREQFRSAMKATLVKESKDHAKFDEYFPIFFGSNHPPEMQDIQQQLTPEQQKMLEQAMQALQGNLRALQDLMRQMMQGQPFSQDQLDNAAQQAGLGQANDMADREWYERRMQRQLNMQQMQQMIDQLMEQLRQMGMSGRDMQQLRQMMEQNADGLSEQVSQYAGMSIAERMASQEPQPRPDLLDVPFTRLGDAEVDQIRDEIRRLAARLRSRASLRQKRAKAGALDPRRILRANMRYGGTPIELKYRTHHVKPSLVLICDVSTSMRYCAEFLLTLIYELQDQVARTNSYVFIGDMVDISMTFKEHEPMTAIEAVLKANPPGYYSTNLGNSLNTFREHHLSVVTGRTTIILVGDGRNNYNNPRTDIVQDLHRRARRLIWFNPESPSQWNEGDSDMYAYAPHSDGVYRVATLRQLAAAVDKILVDG